MNQSDVPEYWEWCSVGDVCDTLNGYAFDSEHFVEESSEGLPIIRIRDLPNNNTEANFAGEYRDKYVVENGDILISMDGHFDVYRWKGGKSLLNQRVCKLHSFSDSIDKRYLEFFLREPLKRIEQETEYTTVKHLSATQIREIELPLPPIDEQHAIAEKLDSLLVKIQETQEAQEEVDEISDKLLFSLFLDMVDEVESKDVQTREVITESQYGISEAMNEEGKGYPILRMGNYDSKGRMDYTELKHVEISNSEFEKYRLKEGDVLFNRTNSKELVGKTAIYDGQLDNAVFASYLIRVYLDDEKVLPEYFVNYLNSPRGRSEIDKKSKQAVSQANINSTELREMDFELPSLSQQQEIIENLNVVKKNIEEIRTASQRKEEVLEKLPKALLKKAFRGDLVEYHSTGTKQPKVGGQSSLETFQS